MASSFPKMQKSSASFSQSIRNRLRLKNLQAQAKNFCRVLDIRVSEIVKTNMRHFHVPNQLTKISRDTIPALGRSIRLGNENTVVMVYSTGSFNQLFLLIEPFKLPQKKRKRFFCDG